MDDKLTNGAVINQLPLTSHRLSERVQVTGRKRERTSMYPADEKAVYDNRDQRGDDDGDLASLVRSNNNKAVSAIQQRFWVKAV